MDEPSDFGFTTVGTSTLTFTTNSTNAVAGWCALEKDDGSIVIAPTAEAARKLNSPPRKLGWEGHGGANRDGREPVAELAQAIKRLAQRDKAIDGSNRLANAITALHGQRRPDGRPEFFIPEIG